MSLVLKNISAHAAVPAPVIKLDAARNASKVRFEKIAVIGLGYVGLPLATRLAYQFEDVVGFDVSSERVASLSEGCDKTNEVSEKYLALSYLRLSSNRSDIKEASFYIVAVPTPVTANLQPDLSYLRAACSTIAPFISTGDVIVFESTVYPGATEEICGPLLERLSGLKMGFDFTLGYSPERINPGDKSHTIESVKKVVSGQNRETLARVSRVYQRIVTAGLHEAPSIKVAETAKILENVQRDVNIALMNEVSRICSGIGIRSKDVINAAATKWNFARYEPGLVGGHCIGVDPFYLADVAKKVGVNPDITLAGRRVNDGMVQHVVDQVIRMLFEIEEQPANTRIAVCGITFKEDVPDLRNSKGVELVERLKSYGMRPLVHDPHCDPCEAQKLGVEICDLDELHDLDLVVVPVPHRRYRRDLRFLKRLRKGGGIVDVKGAFSNHKATTQHPYWSL